MCFDAVSPKPAEKIPMPNPVIVLTLVLAGWSSTLFAQDAKTSLKPENKITSAKIATSIELYQRFYQLCRGVRRQARQHVHPTVLERTLAGLEHGYVTWVHDALKSSCLLVVHGQLAKGTQCADD